MMSKTLRAFLRQLQSRQLARYVVVGGSTFGLDFSLLFLLHGEAGLALGLAISIAYWLSVGYNFSLNRTWTFSLKDRANLRKHLSLYLVVLGFNYLFSFSFILLLDHHLNYLVAKALAVLIQTSWTYYIYKHLIFVN
jgi:putative flippase GtrA